MVFDIIFKVIFRNELTLKTWFFCSKLSLEANYIFWDIYLLENDQYLIFFISIALLLENRERIIQTETSAIPILLSSIKFETIDEIKNIFAKYLYILENYY